MFHRATKLSDSMRARTPFPADADIKVKMYVHSHKYLIRYTCQFYSIYRPINALNADAMQVHQICKLISTPNA